jgi:hypothetical protein
MLLQSVQGAKVSLPRAWLILSQESEVIKFFVSSREMGKGSTFSHQEDARRQVDTTMAAPLAHATAAHFAISLELFHRPAAYATGCFI